ncbi:hypothetical protein [Oceanobacillus salinisoli]|uniref:hypothetical protein n=1 Tax=Oceanobacillus salinisoli TaxID=2678611 RepID=UPI0012E2ADBA|nr:hypothetical protein [Oceanobacillus salinisoli]
MKMTLKTWFIFFIATIALGGCNTPTEEEAVMQAREEAIMVFEEDTPIESNTELDDTALYISNKMEVQNADKNNLILEDGNQTYILFNNPIEDQFSELNYHAAETNQALILESFQDNEKFGYIRVLPDEEEGYELQVGVGGVKITTYTSKENLSDDAEEMMKMAKYYALNQS